MALLEVKNLDVVFHNETESFYAARDVSFELEPGEVLGIVGESGSGKSVTALSLLGLLPFPKVTHGEKSSICFHGKELIGNRELEKIRGNKIAFVFQEPMSSLNPLHKIEHQISEALTLHRGFSSREAKKEVLRLLKMTGIKNARQRMKAYPYELSGGQRQRVMIAMAMANNPEILIADEPTTALDVTIQKQIIDLLLRLRQKHKMALIFISHDLRLIRKVADKVLVMKNGKVIEQGKVEEIFDHPKQAYTRELINSVYSLKNNKKAFGGIVMTARDLEVKYVLKKNFWGKAIEYLRAVDGVSLELYRNETLGIVGESGSGKTTLGLAIANLVQSSGLVSFENIYENKNVIRSNKSFRRIVQVVFQDPFNSLNPRMSVEEIVGEGLEVHFSELDKVEKIMRICKVLHEVGLGEDSLQKYPHEFSGGQRQRIAIARALILEPKILILDEPTSALDVTIQKQVLNLLQEIQERREISYIFISHDMNAIKSIADRIAVIRDGKLIEIGSSSEILYNPKQDYTRELISAVL